MLIDSHAHLDMLSSIDDLDNIITRSKDAGVKYIQTICTKLGDVHKLIEIADKYHNVFVSVGIHPNEVENHELTNCAELIKLATHDKIIGFGETGLDYFYEASKKQLQINSFKEHILASQESGLPLIVHTRDAEVDTALIIKEHMVSKSFSGIIHCFTASKKFAKEMLDVGFYISFSGIITFKNAGDLRDIVKFVPIDRILIETDSPYLAPVPMRGNSNEPSYVLYVAQEIANIKSLKLEEVAHITSKNFFKLFARANAFQIL